MKISDKYDWFDCLLLYFLEDGYIDFKDRDDKETIRRYIKTFDNEDIKQAVQQGKEILQLKEFPFKWIGDTSNRLPFNDIERNNEQGYKEWTQWIVNTLEEEAKKARKL